jgi:hypothetical protein
LPSRPSFTRKFRKPLFGLEDFFEHCLQLRFDAEEVESALLDERRRCEKGEGLAAAEAHGVSGEAGEIGEQASEAVDG